MYSAHELSGMKEELKEQSRIDDTQVDSTQHQVSQLMSEGPHVHNTTSQQELNQDASLFGNISNAKNVSKLHQESIREEEELDEDPLKHLKSPPDEMEQMHEVSHNNLSAHD